MKVVPTHLNIDWSGLTLPDPKTVNNGSIGNLIEQHIASLGYNVKPGSIVDLPDLGYYGVEIKSKQIDSDSAYTIGSTTLNQVLNRDWNNSHFKKKLQIQLMVEVGRNSNFQGYVRRHFIVNFVNNEIQEKLRDSYETARKNAALGLFGPTAGGKFGFIEKTEDTSKRRINSNLPIVYKYSFRIYSSSMKILQNLSVVSRNPLFEIS